MSVTKFAVAIATFSIIAGSAVAGVNVLGAWKGKIKINISKLPKATNPQQQAMMDQQVAKFSKATIALNLGKNGTYSINMIGMTPPGATAPPAQTGTWVLKGNTLTLKGSEPKAVAQVFTIGKGGKTFTGDVHGTATLNFSR